MSVLIVFRCDQYVAFEGASTVALIAGELHQIQILGRLLILLPLVCECTIGQSFILHILILHLVIMILRVYALYARNTYVLFFLMILWVAQIIISSVGLSSGFGEPHLQL